MSPNDIVRMIYALVIGYLSVEAYGTWGLLIGPTIIVAAATAALVFGKNTS